jgi:hypothetical protein
LINLTIDFADVNTTADKIIYLREGVSVTKPEDLPGTLLNNHAFG